MQMRIRRPAWPWSRRSRPHASDRHASDLINASRTGVVRALDLLPEAHLADAFLDLASRAGIDLAELVERARERAGELATRAGENAAGLLPVRPHPSNLADRAQQMQGQAAQQAREAFQQMQSRLGRQAQELAQRTPGSEVGRQAHELTLRARERAGELAALAGAEGLAAVIAPRKRPSRLPLVLGLAAGVVAGGSLAYLLAQRRQQARRPAALRPAVSPAPVVQPSAQLTAIQSPAAPAPARPASQDPLAALRQRFNRARLAAREAREETERKLGRQYHSAMEHEARQ